MKYRILVVTVLIFLLGSAAYGQSFESRWPADVERVWAGPEYWANPLQDWRISQGRLECAVSGGNRNVFLLTRELSPNTKAFSTRVNLGRVDPFDGELTEGWVGFRLGIRGFFNDYRDSAVRGTGLQVGMDTKGRLFIGKVEDDAPAVDDLTQELALGFEARRNGATYTAVLSAYDADGKKLAEEIREKIDPQWLAGGMALVCSAFAPGETPVPRPDSLAVRDWGGRRKEKRRGNVRFWFSQWTVVGMDLEYHPQHAYGPILFAQYTLSRKTLKLTAQMPPLGDAPGKVYLQIMENGDGDWAHLAESEIDPLARTASFRIQDWDDERTVPYRLVYTLRTGYSKSDSSNSGSRDTKEYYYQGTIRKDPATKFEIVVAAFTGNHDFGFPHSDIVEHVRHFNPDLLVFTGDQVYEPCGGYGIQRSPVEVAALDYLRKWYIYGWEHRELFRDRPVVSIPDDHDVYQGNIWGAGGRHTEPAGAKGQDKGGYVMPAEWVNMVHTTQTSHLPDPVDPTPIEQGISVYYTELNVGGVSFAIVADRMWKSAPAMVLPDAKIVNGWPQNPDYDAALQGDPEGAELLGSRQEKFLEQWATDWSGGTWMKCLVSQTIFANVATLPQKSKSDGVTHSLKIMKPGEYAQEEKIVMDHDSNGWPRSARNRVLKAIRKGFSFHIAGDQHLGSTIQYGVDTWNDAGYALCVPSVANIFPRRWFPPEKGANHVGNLPPYTGEYRDGFGNPITVWAVSNPHAVEHEPRAIHQRAPGYGIVTFDRRFRKITMTNWPRWINTGVATRTPYPGWPIEIDQTDNFGSESTLRLPRISVSGYNSPVVEVYDERDRSLLYSLRIKGRSFEPFVFDAQGTYTITVGEPGTKRVKKLIHIKPVQGPNVELLHVDLKTP